MNLSLRGSEQVMRINRDQIQPPPLSVLSVAHQYISGLARLEDRLLIILDIDHVVEWIESEKRYEFLVAPAELRFRDVSDLRMTVD